MNTEDFPKSVHTCDSLAEALFQSGDVAEARATYPKALESTQIPQRRVRSQIPRRA
jgi:hypothetical protein